MVSYWPTGQLVDSYWTVSGQLVELWADQSHHQATNVIRQVMTPVCRIKEIMVSLIAVVYTNSYLLLYAVVAEHNYNYNSSSIRET